MAPSFVQVQSRMCLLCWSRCCHRRHRCRRRTILVTVRSSAAQKWQRDPELTTEHLACSLVPATKVIPGDAILAIASKESLHFLLCSFLNSTLRAHPPRNHAPHRALQLCDSRARLCLNGPSCSVTSLYNFMLLLLLICSRTSCDNATPATVDGTKML